MRLGQRCSPAWAPKQQFKAQQPLTWGPGRARAARVVTRAVAQGDGGYSLIRLQAALEVAISTEDYAKAAKLRDLIRAASPAAHAAANTLELQQQLEDAVAAQRFQEAARLRDVLRSLAGDRLMQELPEELLAPQSGCPPTTSETLSASGVRVAATSAFVMCTGSQHLFTYTIRVTNETETSDVQLRSHYWLITDGEGHAQHGRGSGMGGGQPVLGPGQYIEYQSTCPISTPVGCMEGFVEVRLRATGGDGEGQPCPWGTPFQASIQRFGLNGLRTRPRRRRTRFWEMGA